MNDQSQNKKEMQGLNENPKLADIAFDISSIKGITQDSRKVLEGYLFAALPGTKMDGAKFIPDAISHGAKFILTSSKADINPYKEQAHSNNVTFIQKDNPKQFFAYLSALFYGCQPHYIAGVTGTNGKTTTVNFLQQIWERLDKKAVSIGTLGTRGSGMLKAGQMTTPDAASLHAELADLASAQITHLSMEASSHGLDQYRLDGVNISAAAFTNLSRDHLDYHADMEEYFTAKSRLFSEVMTSPGIAVLNADSDCFEKLVKLCQQIGHHVISYGYKAKDIKIKSVKTHPQGQEVACEVFENDFIFTLPLVGDFQVMNALAALGLAVAEKLSLQKPYQESNENLSSLIKGDDLKELVECLSQLEGVPGRLQYVPGHKKAAIYIDYAHTPDALQNVLKALKAHTNNKLICLFGCGGDRDKGKRPLMAEIASGLADEVIITDDNPRSENPENIREEIRLGLGERAADDDGFWKDIGDRKQAIEFGVRNLEEGDVLLIAGKGHEQGQVFEDRTEPFDDFTQAKQAIEALDSA